METVSVGNSSRLHLLERYPELLFLLSYTPFAPYQPKENPLHLESIDEEMRRFFDKWELEGVDIFYLYGIGLGHHYCALRRWLKERRERRVVFLEEDLGVLMALLEEEHAEDLLFDPQVAIHFLSTNTPLDEQLEGIVAHFPSDRVEVAAIESYQKKKQSRFQSLRLKIFRCSSVSHAILTEALYGHKLLGNLLRNIKRWPNSFFATGLKGKFRDIPAIICGAGPSLSETVPLLKTLEDCALIIAGGSTIAALSNQGVFPHLGLALDPNEEEFDRLKIGSAYEMPLIYATRLQPDVFNALNGERGYLISDTGGTCERYFEKAMGIEAEAIGPELGAEAFSVTTLAIALAVEMGCNPILLNGIDLAYTGMHRYAEGVIPSSAVEVQEIRQQKKAPERLLKRKNIHGHYVHTLVKWVMESECIAAYAKAHPEVRLINVSANGIGFEGITNVSLAEIVETELKNSLDLRALVHREIEQLKLPLSSEKIFREIEEISESLLRLGSIAEEMLEELERVKDKVPFGLSAFPTGKMTILEIDFQEEKAFECLFPTLGPALDRLLSRAFFSSPHSTQEEQLRLQVESKIGKWKQFKEMIHAEIALFEQAKKGF